MLRKQKRNGEKPAVLVDVCCSHSTIDTRFVLPVLCIFCERGRSVSSTTDTANQDADIRKSQNRRSSLRFDSGLLKNWSFGEEEEGKKDGWLDAS